MNQVPAWDHTRWRQIHSAEARASPPPHTAQGTAGRDEVHVKPSSDNLTPPSSSTTLTQHRTFPHAPPPPPPPSTFLSRTTLPPRRPDELTAHSPTPTDAWRSLANDDRESSSSIDNSLPTSSLAPDISKVQDASYPSPTYGRRSQDRRLHPQEDNASAMSLSHTSLPSFASFRDGVNHGHESSERHGSAAFPPTSCYCSQLRPLIQILATAVAQLDETVQGYFVPGRRREFDSEHDQPVHALQRAVERLRSADHDLQSVKDRHLSRQSCERCYLLSSTSETRSPLSSKRHADLDIIKDAPSSTIKRQRTASTVDAAVRQSSPASLVGEEQDAVQSSKSADGSLPSQPPSRLEILVDATQHAAHYSEHPSHLLLPSPASLVNTLPVTASAHHHVVTPVSPTATSSNVAPSIHSTSTSSATSQHIADLQHQITLKSLALQSLQSEHTSLLQKWHRERVKSQAIDKKAQVADQEVNELTAKNEELLDQVKQLESQVSDIDRKREDESRSTTREKEQWGRMLEMSGRLHMKTADERQKLLEEKVQLEQRVLWYEEEHQLRFEKSSEAELMTDEPGDSTRQLPASDVSSQAQGRSGPTASRPAPVRSPMIASILQSRLDILRKALEDAKQHSSLIDEKTRELSQQRHDLEDVINRALNEQLPAPAVHSPPKQSSSWQSRSVHKHASDLDHIPPISATPDSVRPQPIAAESLETRRFSLPQVPSFEALVAAGRAESPGPDELGFGIPPSTSSPEELINALGPVPMALSTLKRVDPAVAVASSEHDRAKWQPINQRSHAPGQPHLSSPPESAGRDQKSSVASSEHHVQPPPPSSSSSSASSSLSSLSSRKQATVPEGISSGPGSRRNSTNSASQQSDHLFQSSAGAMLPPPRPSTIVAAEPSGSWRSS